MLCSRKVIYSTEFQRNQQLYTQTHYPGHFKSIYILVVTGGRYKYPAIPTYEGQRDRPHNTELSAQGLVKDFLLGMDYNIVIFRLLIQNNRFWKSSEGSFKNSHY